MNSFKEIGGYFGLELNVKYDNIKDFLALNSAGNCLRYIIKAFEIKKIHVPFYTCPAVWEAIKKENCEIEFYHINKNFMPAVNFCQDDFILYTNYFGICAKNVKNLALKYKNLIIDNAQAFYMPKYGIASFNSIRKFFGVPDGALLKTGRFLNYEIIQDTSYQNFSHLLKRLDVDAQFGYQDFCTNEDLLKNKDIKKISNLTKLLFNTINIELAKQKRIENFKYLNKHLSNSNELNITLDKDDVPMVYPYLIKNKNFRANLIKNKIYIATYWTPQAQGTQENIFEKYLLPLPVDQRYCCTDLDKILEVIDG